MGLLAREGARAGFGGGGRGRSRRQTDLVGNEDVQIHIYK